jgi:ankyrin repeat protein
MAPASLAATNQKANSDLLEAAEAGDELKVAAALDQPDVDVNCCEEGYYRRTPLLLACDLRHRETQLSVVRLLLKDGRVNVNARDIQGQTALHRFTGGQSLVEEILLSERTDIDWNAADMIGQTPLLWFARMRHAESVRLLIGVASVNLFATTIDGFTALHQVAETKTFAAWGSQGDISDRCNIVDLVLEEVGRRGHNFVSFVDATDILNRSALHYIAEEGCIEILESLCNFSANMNVNGVDFHGLTPLHLAVRNGHDAVVERLLQLPTIDANVRSGVDFHGLTPLELAVRSGDLAMVKRVLQLPCIDANVRNGPDFHGLTPLHLAVRNGHHAVVERLLQRPSIDANVRATVNASNPAKLKRFEKLDGLVEIYRPDLFSKRPEEQPSRDLTPLHFAAMDGRMGVVRLLLEWKGIKIAAKDSTGLTPLHYSVQNGQSEVLELLLEKGKPFATLDYDGQCNGFKDLLRLATEREEKTTAKKIAIQLLNTLGSRMKAFADIYNKFSGNQSFGDQSRLLAFAAVSNHYEIIKYIVKWQPEVNVNEKSKWAAIPDLVATPLHFAVVERDVVTVVEGGVATVVEGDVATVAKRGHFDAVQELLEHPKLDVNAENSDGETPLQIVVEAKNLSGDPNLKAIEKVLLERPAVKDFVDRLYRDRQVFVDAANAILVGAALIATVTFAGWLTPPLGYTPYYDFSQPFPAPPGAYESYAAIKQNPKVKAFWVFNSLSFFFAIATVLASADAAMPSLDNAFITRVVISVRRSLIVASSLLVMSVVCVLGAFASGGFAVLPPLLKYDTSMIITVCVGGTVCMIILAKFLRKLAKANYI